MLTLQTHTHTHSHRGIDGLSQAREISHTNRKVADKWLTITMQKGYVIEKNKEN